MLSSNALQIITFETLAITLFVAVGALLCRSRVRALWLIAIPPFFFLKAALGHLGAEGFFGDWIGGRFNWEGKIITTGVTLAIAAVLFWGQREKLGLTLRQDGPAPRLGIGLAIFTAIATALFAAFYLTGTNEGLGIDMVYQLTMPSIDEEIYYRGLLLAMLIIGFTPKGEMAAGPITVTIAAIIATLQFWAVHSIGTDGGWGFSFDPWFALNSLVYGVLWVGIRLATRSILLPTLLHSWANIANYFI